MINAENLQKSFGSIKAVDNISFHIKESEIFGFLGPNGAGKTTTIRMLATLISPDSGEITIDGKDFRHDSEYIRSITGILTETPGMYDKISGYENLEFFSSFYNISGKKIKENIKKYLKMFGLWERKDDIVAAYSKGMKQKLALARALIHEPKILFLDEPTSGLDPESAFMVRNFIESLKNERTTVFLCTHNLQEASMLSDRVCIIKNRIIKIASLDDLQNIRSEKNIEIVLNSFSKNYVDAINRIEDVEIVKTDGNKIFISVKDPERSNPVIISDLIKSGAEILYFNEIKASLEEIYLELINTK